MMRGRGERDRRGAICLRASPPQGAADRVRARLFFGMPEMPSIALATAAHLPDLTADDRCLLDELRARGARAEPAVWSEPRDWTTYDAVVIRSCWDSHLRRDEFVAWARRLAEAGVRLLNPAPLIEWNTDKRYLRDLASHGVHVVPTIWVERAPGEPPVLHELLAGAGWRDAVVKPAISAGAHHTWRTSAAQAADHQARFAALVRDAAGAVMVQPLMHEVLEEGEWSLVFLGGRYSHAVRKQPAAGDFRVQTEHGGRSAADTPSARLVHDASEVVRAAARTTGLAPGEILYARVDGVVQHGHLVLMELECTEPSLFLDQASGAPARLADALLDRRDEAAA